MKILTLVLACWLLPGASRAQLPDCARFKEGRFRTADTRIGAVVLTERNSIYQTESTEALKLVVRFRISWSDNCTFTLKLDKVIRNENKEDIPSNFSATVKIMETSSTSYIQEISSSLSNGIYRTTVSKID